MIAIGINTGIIKAMDPSNDANWWQFSIDSERRGDRITAGPAGLREVNPTLPDGRRLIDYHTYIGLDRLLSCQVPGSMVPDERVFIVTHQLFELAFKQMIFDLSVISATLAHLIDLGDAARFYSLCTTTDDRFWLPALTASGRLRYAGTTLLPSLCGLLASSEGKDETFSSLEFRKFRPNLQPASGFQSAQFRLIQRALGKGGLLAVRLFPAQEYWKNYEAADDRGPARVTDPVILRDDASIADPESDSLLAPAAGLDECAHQLLERLAGVGSRRTSTPEIPAISNDDLEAAALAFHSILSGQRSLQERAGTKPPDAAEKDRAAEAIFRRDLEEAVRKENERRGTLLTARSGAFHLHDIAPQGSLALVLNRIVAADAALHGKQEGSFLSLHFRMVAERIRDLYGYAREAGEAEPPRGTGGGGVPYLGYVSRNLIPLFPALVAYQGLEKRDEQRDCIRQGTS
jgi:tryptophan 2,3-dioxygenase